VFLYCCVYVYLFLFVLSSLIQGLPPPSENSIAVSKYVSKQVNTTTNNNINNNNNKVVRNLGVTPIMQ
jgi:hypothetical protein